MQNDSAIIEELTAYLDGELDVSDVQRVEHRIGTDPTYRAEMQALQRTWDIFDNLPTGEASPSFTQTTMEMVVGDAIDQVRAKGRKWWLWPIRICILMGLPLLLFGLGFGVTRYVQMEPNRQLLNNVSIIENIDRYRRSSTTLHSCCRWMNAESLEKTTNRN